MASASVAGGPYDQDIPDESLWPPIDRAAPKMSRFFCLSSSPLNLPELGEQQGRKGLVAQRNPASHGLSSDPRHAEEAGNRASTRASCAAENDQSTLGEQALCRDAKTTTAPLPASARRAGLTLRGGHRAAITQGGGDGRPGVALLVQLLRDLSQKATVGRSEEIDEH